MPFWVKHYETLVIVIETLPCSLYTKLASKPLP